MLQISIGWKGIAALLSAYGFLKETRPSEPFVTPYLLSDKNLTSEQVNQEVYPVGTYSTLALLVLVFLVTDWLRYKPIILAQSISAIITWSLLIWGQSLLQIQLLEVSYGFMVAADVAYFTYMYAMVERERYAKVSAIARIAFLLGRFLSGVISQVTVSTGALSYLDLNYLSFSMMIASTLVALTLPTSTRSFYFHRRSDGPAEPKTRQSVALLLWTDFIDAYSKINVIKWSLWWALATCGQLQVLNYVQVLWDATMKEAGTENEKPLNGAVEAVYTLLGACGAWLATHGWRYREYSDILLSVVSLIAGAIIATASVMTVMAWQYVLYIAFATLYHSVITVASSEVAQLVREDTHGLIFGINTLIALCLQSALTLAVAGQGGLELDIRTQFLVYGGYFGVIGVAFALSFIFTIVYKKIRHTNGRGVITRT